MIGAVFSFRVAAAGFLIAAGSFHGERRFLFLGVAIIAALWEVCTRLTPEAPDARR